jgi:hypothetical protein
VKYVSRERAVESTFASGWSADAGALQRLYPLRGSNEERRTALLGPGNHTSFLRRLSEHNGRGTWRKLLGEVVDAVDEKEPTHAVWMDLPEVLGQMVALGVAPAELVGCLRQGDFGTLRLEFTPKEWTSPEQRVGVDGEVEREKGKEWKRGWWVTKRKGMGVWVS